MSKHPRTARLAFEPFRESDAEDLARLLADPDLTRNITSNGASEEKCRHHARARIAWHRGVWEARGYGPWALRLLNPGPEAPGRVIGWCGFTDPHREDEDPEILYGLAAELRGQGFATEAAEASLDWLFANTDAGGAAAVISARLNPGSVRVTEKLGFLGSGTLAFEEFLSDSDLAAEVLDYELWRLANHETADPGLVAFQAAYRIGQLAIVSGTEVDAIARCVQESARPELRTAAEAAFREGLDNATMDTFRLGRDDWIVAARLSGLSHINSKKFRDTILPILGWALLFAPVIVVADRRLIEIIWEKGQWRSQRRRVLISRPRKT